MFRCNAEDRADLIESQGEEYFYSNPDFEYLYEPDVPLCFIWLYNVFLEIYNHCDEVMTWRDIEAYCHIRGITLTQIEVDYLLLMNGWANKKIKEMRGD